MTRMEKLYQITKQMDALLDQSITQENREQIIHDLNKLIEERDQYLKLLSAPYSKTEEKIGHKVIQLNQTVEKRMQTLFQQLKKEMQQIKQQKKSNRSYMNPFEHTHSADAMFLDQKK